MYFISDKYSNESNKKQDLKKLKLEHKHSQQTIHKWNKSYQQLSQELMSSSKSTTLNNFDFQKKQDKQFITQRSRAVTANEAYNYANTNFTTIEEIPFFQQKQNDLQQQQNKFSARKRAISQKNIWDKDHLIDQQRKLVLKQKNERKKGQNLSFQNEDIEGLTREQQLMNLRKNQEESLKIFNTIKSSYKSHDFVQFQKFLKRQKELEKFQEEMKKFQNMTFEEKFQERQKGFGKDFELFLIRYTKSLQKSDQQIQEALDQVQKDQNDYLEHFDDLEKKKINQFKISMNLKRKMMNARLLENKPLEIQKMYWKEPKSIFNQLANEKQDFQQQQKNNVNAALNILNKIQKNKNQMGKSLTQISASEKPLSQGSIDKNKTNSIQNLAEVEEQQDLEIDENKSNQQNNINKLNKNLNFKSNVMLKGLHKYIQESHNLKQNYLQKIQTDLRYQIQKSQDKIKLNDLENFSEEKLFLEAVQEGKQDLVQEFLLSYPNFAFINNTEGQNPIHRAIIRGQIHLLDILIKAGANLFQKDEMGRTPLELAKKYCNTKQISLVQNSCEFWDYQQKKQKLSNSSNSIFQINM